MTLKKDALKRLTYLGFDTTKLIEAIKADDEQDFTIPEINNLSEADLATRDKEVIAAAKPEIFKTGKEAGIEIANKAIAKKYNLTDVDVKDVDKVITALDTHVAKGDTGLKEQVALLQKDKDTLTAAVDAEKKRASNAIFDAELITHFPANRNGLTDKQYLMLVKDSLQFEEADGVRVVKKDGSILRDKTTQAPVTVKDALTNLFTENKWIKNGDSGGRGGGDNSGGGGSGIKTQSKAQEQFVKDNPDKGLISPEYNAYVQKLAKETTDFNWDE